MARVNGKNEFVPCRYNRGVECVEDREACARCGFAPVVMARRVERLRKKHGYADAEPEERADDE